MVLFVLLAALLLVAFIGIAGVRREERGLARRRFVEAVARGDMDDAEEQLGRIFPPVRDSKP